MKEVMILIGLDIRSKSFVIHAIDRKKRILYREKIEASRESLREIISRFAKGAEVGGVRNRQPFEMGSPDAIEDIMATG